MKNALIVMEKQAVSDAPEAENVFLVEETGNIQKKKRDMCFIIAKLSIARVMERELQYAKIAQTENALNAKEGEGRSAGIATEHLM